LRYILFRALAQMKNFQSKIGNRKAAASVSQSKAPRGALSEIDFYKTSWIESKSGQQFIFRAFRKRRKTT
jgi:hypothetical protein